MHVSVNGVRLFFDAVGAKFVPERVTAVIRISSPDPK